MAYGMPTACGIHGHCQPQLVVESDGSVYPCDFYCLDEYRIGNDTFCGYRSFLDTAGPALQQIARQQHNYR